MPACVSFSFWSRRAAHRLESGDTIPIGDAHNGRRYNVRSLAALIAPPCSHGRAPATLFIWGERLGTQSARGRGEGNGWREKTPNTKRTRWGNSNPLCDKDLWNRKVDNEAKRTQIKATRHRLSTPQSAIGNRQLGIYRAFRTVPPHDTHEKNCTRRTNPFDSDGSQNEAEVSPLAALIPPSLAVRVRTGPVPRARGSAPSAHVT